jgi:hypothetical protein
MMMKSETPHEPFGLFSISFWTLVGLALHHCFGPNTGCSLFHPRFDGHQGAFAGVFVMFGVGLVSSGICFYFYPAFLQPI